MKGSTLGAGGEPISPIKSQKQFGNILEQNSLKSESETSQKNLLKAPAVPEKQQESRQTNRESQLDRPSVSRASTDHAGTEKIWTAEEILADDELWRVTDSSEDEESEVVSSKDKTSSRTKPAPTSKISQKSQPGLLSDGASRQ